MSYRNHPVRPNCSRFIPSFSFIVSEEEEPSPIDPASLEGLVFYVDAKLGVLDSEGSPASNNEGVGTWTEQVSAQNLTQNGEANLPHWVADLEESGQPALIVDYPTDETASLANTEMGEAFQAAFVDVHDFTIMVFDRPPADAVGTNSFVIGQPGVTGYLTIAIGQGFNDRTWTATFANAAVSGAVGYSPLGEYSEVPQEFQTLGIRVASKVLYAYENGNVTTPTPWTPGGPYLPALADLEGFTAPVHFSAEWRDGSGGNNNEDIMRASRSWVIFNRALSQAEMDGIRAFWLDRYGLA